MAAALVVDRPLAAGSGGDLECVGHQLGGDRDAGVPDPARRSVLAGDVAKELPELGRQPRRLRQPRWQRRPRRPALVTESAAPALPVGPLPGAEGELLDAALDVRGAVAETGAVSPGALRDIDAHAALAAQGADRVANGR